MTFLQRLAEWWERQTWDLRPTLRVSQRWRDQHVSEPAFIGTTWQADKVQR